MDFIISLLITVLVVTVFVVIIRSLSKKEIKTIDELLSGLSTEQIEDLKDNQIENFNEEKITWNQKALIIEVTDKGKNYFTRVVWFNTILPNALLNTFQYADIKMKKEVFDAKRLKSGSIVTISVDANNIKFAILYER